MGHLPDPNEHFRATSNATVDTGVYRVVGTPDDRVTLLRVTDEKGRRRHTGEVVQVAGSTLATRFEPAENPDLGFHPLAIVDRLVTSIKAVYWLVRG
ncbi:hypothetical protein [Halorientalis salina]|uniref:hypothetical protein n=1 Tax=Halorientalis salina TaxID=2932266 RepID=UPI0010AB5439|nr:hypothetical protein [Halorientalis salina]